ncbi:16S rRNA (guanine(527)-N(7))-methyltransferase RsmG (plasmid) [Paracoccus sp. TK19116]|uniref:Ribosomal RNA small subunit methyltransferase G n=1 Tax=Paracoccus albicereus TaxID=2922394 RepID=A0ABT1MM13_9RHOB|nr:16S rRNA (guanine(527)-N(7))-methyltransferase RsmG [Paracoccus albicereus]MCQ0969327.1 16S rRNA (guanine(527)-N(7))-methyltransferase RsmG [Paracoccus albicereus]
MDLYAAQLRRWNPRINLVSAATLDDLAGRHLADSAQIASVIEPDGHWVDLGSGGGLPGIVLSILWQDLGVRLTLVESDRRKAAFLRQMIRELSLSRVRVLAERIESVDPLAADNISARALASLTNLMPYLVRHLAPDGRAWLMKGRSWAEELEAARRGWAFTCRSHTSRTDPDAAILEVSRPSHA